MVEMRQLNTGTARGCVPADIPTLKSVEVRNGDLRVIEILPWVLRGSPFI